VNPLDEAVGEALIGARTPWLDAAVLAVTELGSSVVLTPVLLAVGLALGVRRGAWSPLALLGAAQLGATALYTVGKEVVGRERPDVSPLVEVSGLAMPSGHATQAAAVWLALAAVAVAWLRGREPVGAAPGGASPATVAYGMAGAVAMTVAVSRVYLGVHWFSDVVAGLLLGAAWTGLLLRLTGPALRRELALPTPSTRPAQSAETSARTSSP
jgi:membrane-associated phospholipid phosphatase